MPFVRFSRDKRGYEYVFLVHTGNGRGRSAGSPRVLYWYRTPPGMKIGREPFDEAVRQALEAQYPNIEFDWKRIVSTPMPPPEAENWRERRRAERAMRQARAAEPADEDAAGEEAVAPAREAVSASASEGALADLPAPESQEDAMVAAASASASPSASASGGAPDVGEPTAVEGAGGEPRKRRRRRGGRHRRKPERPGLAAAGDTEPGTDLPGAGPADDSLGPRESPGPRDEE